MKINNNFPLSADVANQKRGGWSPERFDLLRQQSENWFWRSKNRPENDFHEKFHVFQDFSIFDDFRSILVSDSNSWWNFLPGDGLGSPESEFPKISLWMNFFIKNVTLIQIFPYTQLPQRIIIWTRNQDRTVQQDLLQDRKVFKINFFCQIFLKNWFSEPNL